MRTLRVLSVIGVAALFCPNGLAERILVEDVSVIPMTSETQLSHQDVVIEDTLIASITPHGTRRIRRTDRVVPGAGMYLIPGLCDLHVHIKGRPGEFGDILFLYPAKGVTTVLNMSGNSNVLRLREEIAEGSLLGPRIFTTSPILGNVAARPETDEEARALIRRFAEDGYDFIKVYNLIPEEGYWAIIDEANKLGVPVVGHAVRSVGIEGAITAAQDIAHMEELIYGYFGKDLDESKIEPLASRMRDAGIDVIATLIVYHNILRQLEDIDGMLRTPGIEYMPGSLTRTFQPELNPYLKDFDQDDLEEQLRPSFAFLQLLTREFQKAGVRILAGTDVGVEIVVPGYSMHDELEELVIAGLMPYQALEAATVSAADFLGESESFGTLEVGKAADAVLLRADPLEDIRNTREIAGVFVRGSWLSAEEIESRLGDIATKVASE